jgi:hypothetical protein
MSVFWIAQAILLISSLLDERFGELFIRMNGVLARRPYSWWLTGSGNHSLECRLVWVVSKQYWRLGYSETSVSSTTFTPRYPKGRGLRGPFLICLSVDGSVVVGRWDSVGLWVDVSICTVLPLNALPPRHVFSPE